MFVGAAEELHLLLSFSLLTRRHYSDPHIPDLPGIRHFKGLCCDSVAVDTFWAVG